MTTMLEKAARASYDKWIEDVCDLEPEWDTLPESHRARLIDATRAALQAIREPSYAIVDVGTGCIGWRPEFPTATAHAQMRDAFNEMIDAILSEGEA